MSETAVWEGPSPISVAPFEDRGIGQEPRNANGLLDAGKGNEMNSLLQSPEGMCSRGHLDFSPMQPISDL